jgi:Flp pilus assembly protein TadG
MLEVVVIFPLFTMMIFAMLYLGRGWYLRAALEDTVAVGARWAPTSLSGAQGCVQAREAMLQVISGYHLNADGATISIKPHGADWERATQAVVSVSYKLSQAGVPITGGIWGDKTLSTQLFVPIDAFNNRYDNGWQSCK